MWLSVQRGAPPWIALGLAGAFSGYGLIRKTAPVEAVAGLASETMLAAPLGILYLLAMNQTGQGAFGHQGLRISVLLVGAGVVTAIPLMLFAYGARRVPYSTVGLIQYLQPSMQLLLGVLVYGEAFTRTDGIGFGLIWAALALYTADGFRRMRAVGA